MGQSNTIAVTGASRGIGSAIARELAARGFRVACLTRNAKGVEDAEIDPATRERMIAIAYEATDEGSIREALRVAASADGLLGLVNNAGIHWIKPATQVSAAEFQEMMSVNALGTFLACREAHQYLKKDGGIIVNIGSYYDRLGVRDSAVYAASKAAIGAITRCLAVEWARDGIRVLSVAPGFIATDLNRDFRDDERFMEYVKQAVPVGKLGQPGDVARLVAAIFSERIDFLTGETIYLDGGHGIAL
ncbi:MAG TPA: SDR family oxidoreductase [Alphaproteobacteria bacterium]|nr:SDR family oxidoreductase [Alphaproteobacteria bacterium]